MAKNICPKCNIENVDGAAFCDNCGNSLEPNKKTEELENNESETPTTTWKIINSWWILLTIPLGILNWIAYLYVGYGAKKRKWSYLGLSYFAYWILLLILANMFPGSNGLNFVIGLSFLILWVFGIVYAFKIRNEYLIRLELNNKIRKETKSQKEEMFRKELENL